MKRPELKDNPHNYLYIEKLEAYADYLERKNSSLHSVMRCYVKEIDQFYEDTGYCDDTNEFGIRKNYKKGDGWDWKSPNQMIKDWMKWKRNNA